MTIRNAMKSSVCALLLYGLGSFGSAHTQGGQAPFTIRRPPDGATVREKVKIEIPRPSIAPGGFVGIYLDGKFQLALATEEEEEGGKPFTFVWDTKENKISDGEHTIRAVLYEPTAGGESSASQKASSEVKLTVANKIHDGPTSLQLRYKNHEGENLEYGREGKSLIVGGVSETGTTTSDQMLADVKSKLQFDVQDVRFDNSYGSEVSLVRNKLTELSVLQNGQETILDPGQLSNSMYQELSPQGIVYYETGTAAGLAEFMSVGLPVNNTLELPELPKGRVQVGDSWNTERQRLDIPGLPPALQPRVTLTNKLEDLEWQSGYPTARIHQTYNGTPPGVKMVQFGPVEVTSPKITFERDIYVAYNSGKLVKTMRSLSVAGRTTSFGGAQNNGGGMAMPGSGGFPGAMGMPGSGGFPGAMGMPGSAGMAAPGGFPGSAGMATPGGFPGSGGGMTPPGGKGRGGGGFPGSGGMSMPGSGGMAVPGSGGFPGSGGRNGGTAGNRGRTISDIMGGARNNGMGGANTGLAADPDKAVTLKATTETQLLTGVSEAAETKVTPAPAKKSVSKPAAKRSKAAAHKKH